MTGPALLESARERRTVARLERLDARVRAPKFSPDGQRGWPDRVVLLPGGLALFVEFKRDGQRERPLQAHRRNELTRLGFVCLIVASDADADALVEYAMRVLRGGRDAL